MNTGLYLDTRAAGEGRPAPLKYAIRRNSETSYIGLEVNIPVEYWDRKHKQIIPVPISKWPERLQINNYIQSKVTKYDTILLRLESEGELHQLTAMQVRDKLLETINPRKAEEKMLCDAMREYIGQIENRRTRQIYSTTLNMVVKLVDNAESVTLNSITPEWLSTFSQKLKDNGAKSENSRSIHLRNLRAVQNYAIDQGYTTNYPWRRYKIKTVKTEKRSMTVGELREFLAAPCGKREAVYRDLFKLMFFLIGINHADLCDLRHEDMYNGRIHYERKKTHQIYNVKVEPEAMELLEKYKGKEWLINVHDRYKDTHDQLKHFNPMLASIIDRPPFDEVTTYWARHTWATIAYNDLDISIDTISAALGHQYGSRVTAVYINPDRKKVDLTNRRMIDWVFYGRK